MRRISAQRECQPQTCSARLEEKHQLATGEQNEDFIFRWAGAWLRALSGDPEGGLQDLRRLNQSLDRSNLYWLAALRDAHSRILVMAGRHQEAIALIDSSLRAPGRITPEWLRASPWYAPVKGQPAFEQLLRQDLTGR